MLISFLEGKFIELKGEGGYLLMFFYIFHIYANICLLQVVYDDLVLHIENKKFKHGFHLFHWSSIFCCRRFGCCECCLCFQHSSSWKVLLTYLLYLENTYQSITRSNTRNMVSKCDNKLWRPFIASDKVLS